MADVSPVTEWKLERLRESYPAWTMARDGEQAFTATSLDGSTSVTGRSPAELECMLHNEAWKPLTAAYGCLRSTP